MAKTRLAQALYEGVEDILKDYGVEHGQAQVTKLPNGDWVIVAGAGEPIESGGFGGGGASGQW